MSEMTIKYKYFILSGTTLYVATFLFIYNIYHLMVKDALSFVAALLFFLVQVVWFFIILNHAATLARLAYFKNPSVSNLAPSMLPKISIIVPIYEEPRGLIEEMVNALASLIYPREKLEVIVVDDSEAKTVISYNYGFFRRLKNYGIDLKYIWRIQRKGYRGGALNEALKIAKSQYIIVLDIDHIPLPCMAWRLASVIMKTDYDIIMFPQEFKNWNHNSITLASYIGYRFDYAFSRKGKTVTNSGFCVGTNWIGDRRKIVEAGGFDEESIVEDMATSMLKWHPHGLKIGLIDEVLAYGLVPDTIESFKKQQYRWSLGAFKLFPKLLKNMWALTFFQRFDYLFNIAWYLIGLTVIFSGIFPVLSVLGVDFLYVVSPLEYIINVIVYTFLQILLYSVPLIIVGESVGRVFKGQAIGTVVASSYTRAFIDAILGRKTRFEVTPKEVKEKSFKKLVKEVSVPFILLYLNLLVLIFSISNPTWRNIITSFWALYNLSWFITAMYSVAKDLFKQS